jgi:hypothetical protein
MYACSLHKTTTMKKIFFLILCINIFSSQAQDRFFGRSYTSNILPKGAIDIEFWHTSRMSHTGQFFNAQDQRMEVEIGLGKNVQTAFYFNRYQKRFSETANETVVSNEIGISNEWKWKVSKPFSKINVALYGEWGVKGGDEIELEAKFIVDKRIGKNLLAFNAVYEFEKEFEWQDNKAISKNWEMPIEFTFGYMYNVSIPLGLGVELRNRNDIKKENGWQNSIFFAGPTINYRGDRWFVIANYLPQLCNVHKTTHSPSSKVLDEHERVEARIIFGISL